MLLLLCCLSYVPSLHISLMLSLTFPLSMFLSCLFYVTSLDISFYVPSLDVSLMLSLMMSLTFPLSMFLSWCLSYVPLTRCLSYVPSLDVFLIMSLSRSLFRCHFHVPLLYVSLMLSLTFLLIHFHCLTIASVESSCLILSAAFVLIRIYSNCAIIVINAKIINPNNWMRLNYNDFWQIFHLNCSCFESQLPKLIFCGYQLTVPLGINLGKAQYRIFCSLSKRTSCLAN